MRLLRKIMMWFRWLFFKVFYTGRGYEVKVDLPSCCLGKLQPISTNTKILDDMKPNERYMLAYNLAREIRRAEGMVEGKTDRIRITLPLVVRDYILADSFSQELRDLISLQDSIGESTNGGLPVSLKGWS